MPKTKAELRAEIAALAAQLTALQAEFAAYRATAESSMPDLMEEVL